MWDAARASTPFWRLPSVTKRWEWIFSVKAIELAMTKAIERGIGARFLVADALCLHELGEQFNTVLDCGLFHVFDDDERERYVDSLAAAVTPGGRYHMLCFSDLQPGDWGPRRVSQDEIRASFSDGWILEPIEPAVIDLTWDPAGSARVAGGLHSHVETGRLLLSGSPLSSQLVGFIMAGMECSGRIMEW